MAEQYQGPIPHFLISVLGSPAGSIPKGAQWLLSFDDLEGSVMPGINSALQYENKPWGIERAKAVVNSEQFQKQKGCVYAQGIGMPGDSLVVNPEGNIMSNSFLRSYVGQGRNQFPELRVTFLETNISFCENFLRPWAIATGMWGLFSRPSGSDKSYRTNLQLYKLGVYSENRPPFIVMKMTFYDICCTSVSEEEYNYDPKTSPTRREARFIYNYYNVDSSAAGLMLNTSSGGT